MAIHSTNPSIQLYSLRALGDLERALDAAAAAGFRRVELVGAHLDHPSRTRELLDARGLTAPSCHVRMEILRERLEEIADACRVIGVRLLFVPAVPPDERDAPLENWFAVGRELGGMASRLADFGITFGYHNHDEIAIASGGVTALDAIFQESNGTPLMWQADVAWLARAGADPATILERHKERLVSVHVKDSAVETKDDPEDNWRVAGHGTLNWTHLWPLCERLGVELFVMEHDQPIDPAQFARMAFEAAAALDRQAAK